MNVFTFDHIAREGVFFFSQHVGVGMKSLMLTKAAVI